jgi:glycosyltransferase involved in cell wall biosynthesis
MALGLLATLRDEAAHLPRFLNLLEQLDGRPEWGPLVCSFYENDSHDGTAAVLAAWLQHHRGTLISEQLGVPRLRGRAVARTQRLAAARNRALEPLLQQQLDWLLVIDADLQVQPAQVLALHRLLQRHPEAAMVCASAVQNVPDVLGEGPWSYYDSWALRDRQGVGGITFAANPFCDQQDRWRWMAGLPVPVAAAFGGMALLPMAVVRQQGLQWQGDEGCEHWAFCAGARLAGPVLACPTVQPVVWHAEPPRWSAAYAAGVRSQLAA